MSATTRRKLLRSGLAGLMVLPWLHAPFTLGAPLAKSTNPAGALHPRASTGGTNMEFVLGMSAAFSGPSRGLGIELYRGAQAYFTHVNKMGGVRGRKILLKLYDDGY